MSKNLTPAPVVDPSAMIVDSELGQWTEVAARAQIVCCEVGDYSYVMNDSDLMFAKVGKFVSVASHVRVNPSNHPMWRPTLHHFTYRSEQYGFGEDDTEVFDWRRQHEVSIGHDAWLGHGVIVLPGRSVGLGAVVGAGSVVTHDVEPFAIVAGVPARRVRDRFPPQVQAALMRIAWWDWEHKRLGEALHDFRSKDIGDFVSKYDPGT